MEAQVEFPETSLDPIASIRDPQYFRDIYQTLRRVSPKEQDLVRVVFEREPSGPQRWTIVVPPECRNLASPDFLEWVEAHQEESFPLQDVSYTKHEIYIMLKFLRKHIEICPELEKVEQMETSMTNEKRPWEDVDNASYFRKILKNMKAKGLGRKAQSPGFIRFGLLGNGHSPNYQLEEASGSIVACFRGLGDQKEAAVSDDAFKSENLSDERFAYADIQQMIARFG